MDPVENDGNGVAEEALPPPPPVTEDVVPEKALEPVKKKVMRVLMARRDLAKKGQKAQLLTNHFKVNVSNVDGHFFHYSVALFCDSCSYVNKEELGMIGESDGNEAKSVYLESQKNPYKHAFFSTWVGPIYNNILKDRTRRQVLKKRESYLMKKVKVICQALM